MAGEIWLDAPDDISYDDIDTWDLYEVAKEFGVDLNEDDGLD